MSNQKNNNTAFRIIFCFSSLLIVSCQTLKESPKFQFSEGYYYSRLYHKKVKKIYIVPGEDSIKIYSAKRIGRGLDTTQTLKLAFPAATKPLSFENYTFAKGSFDIDVLNILFKFRPAINGFPPQLNNNILNAAFYMGRRTDLYKLTYKQTPLGKYERSTTHYGYSFGFFTGIGASRMDEYVTNGALSIQYDGVVGLIGVAGIAALDKLNFGLNIGIDHLFDKNKTVWIYQHRPWVGLSFGLNLN
ncbi:MAG: hypothetical protein M3Y85_05595 [Bacteroidota bacterium]|nr:hypothetical protein [Bacteroidota bacterium]